MSIQFVKRCEKYYGKITFFCQIEDFLKESPVKTENFGVATHRKYKFILRFFLKYDILDKKKTPKGKKHVRSNKTSLLSRKMLYR
jgi:hypothetical protein